MADKKTLFQELREQGVKRIVLGTGSTGGVYTGLTDTITGYVVEVEFFPLSAFDRAGALLTEDNAVPDERSERDTEAPPAVNVPPAMARVLQKGSVS